ncbi:MAG: phenylalanine--tRNA ligase subunit beta [Lentisphaeria bacterium]|nr:phenylalanine--tRNA ligase subunit beta [Lentisphaeria bacterium]
MDISRKWLSDYVALDCDDATLCHKLTMAGIEVEAVENNSTVPEGVVAAKIVDRQVHPNSDHLSVCQVNDGKNTIQIVCGAPNCDAGKIVPLATIGTVFTTPEGDFKIKKSKLRGVESNGMMCSASELGISDDNSGLMILPEDTVIGTPVKSLYPGDTFIELEVTPNRPDCLSMWGVARDVSCLLDVEPKFPEITVPACDTEIADLVTVEAKELCPRYIGRVIENVKIGPSPAWLVERLESIGLRSINNVVDVTNFVMLELGHPLHAFDRDKLEGKRVVVRRAVEGEKITILDGRTIELKNEHLVIADAAKPMALAGIMGGEFSGVTGDTVNILLESAVFNPSNIRSSSRRLGVSTDASYRYERGVDYDMADAASDRAVQLILEVAGGTLASAKMDVNTGRPAENVIVCRFEKIRNLIGSGVSNERIVEILTKLHLKVSDITAEGCKVTAPLFRLDLTREADLAEEVARIDGLEKVPQIAVNGKICHPASEDAYAKVQNLREMAVSLGLYECVTYSITGVPQALTDSRFEESDLIKLDNPLNPDSSVMRPSLFGGMLNVAERNITRGNRNLRLFELDKVFCANAEKYPEERDELIMLLTGKRYADRYSEDFALEYDFYDMKGAVEDLMEMLGVSKYRFTRLDDDKRFKSGNAVAVDIYGRRAGVFGEVNNALTSGWRHTSKVFVALFEAQSLYDASVKASRNFKALAQYPATSRDVAMLVPEDMENGKIIEFIRKRNLANLESVRLFDIYCGKELAEQNKKSMAYELVFRHSERTLTDNEVNSAMDKLRKALESDLKVELR